MIITWILIVLTGLLTVITILPLLRHTHWVVRVCDFPRLQLIVIGTLMLISQFVWLDFSQSVMWLLPIATLLCIGWQLHWVLPYSPLWRKTVQNAKNRQPEHCLRILSSNVLMPNHQVEALLALVDAHQPDILVTLETDQWWQGRLDRTLEQTMPYAVRCPQDNLYGMHVYSRLPLTDINIEFLVEDDVPSVHACVQLESGDWIRFHFLHPAPPSPTENTLSEERDAELIIVARSLAEEQDLPVVVTGDLNDVAWSYTTRLFLKISGLLDPRIGRGMFNTFHAQHTLLRWPLDHLFHSDHFTLGQMQRLYLPGSDHFALLSELVLEPHNDNENRLEEADQDEREWAQEITNKQEVSENDVPSMTPQK